MKLLYKKYLVAPLCNLCGTLMHSLWHPYAFFVAPFYESSSKGVVHVNKFVGLFAHHPFEGGCLIIQYLPGAAHFSVRVSLIISRLSHTKVCGTHALLCI